ncbi:MAG TPA: hypothetical protein VHV10_18020 [Ktedonobacteraceae bacterium]|nr:hypothetical protein [Ktedonobacteraceae bacterium]
MKKRRKKNPLVRLVLPAQSSVPQQGSEVARIRAQIRAEQESAQRALYSSAYGTTQHRFITRRMERMGILHEQLQEIVGEQEAAKALKDAMEDK